MRLEHLLKFLLPAFIPLAILGTEECRSPELPSEARYTFMNTATDPITLDMYGSIDDYASNSNRLQRYLIPAGKSQETVLTVGRTYWIDWYNNTYSINNFGAYTKAAIPWPELSAADVGSIQVALVPGMTRDTVRSVLFNGSGSSSTWKGTLKEGKEKDGNYVFIIRKDMHVQYTFTDLHGAVHSETLPYIISIVNTGSTADQVFSISLVNTSNVVRFQLYAILYNHGFSLGRDSMGISAYPGLSFFGLHRQ